jgi:hypothetical protein
MKSVLIVSLLTLLRLGFPALVLLLAGELVGHYSDKVRSSRGAR